MNLYTHAVVAADGSIERLTDAAGHTLDGHTLVRLAEALTGWPAPEPGRTLRCTPQGQVLWHDPRTLDDLKAARWAQIKAVRAAAIDAPLATLYGRFDCGPADRTNITDAVALLQTLAAAGTPTTVTFTTADNVAVTLTLAQMVHIGLLLGQRVQAAYATARALRAQIDAAQAADDLAAIHWPAPA